MCDSLFVYADSEAGGAANNGGEAVYDRDEWVAGCESVAPDAGEAGTQEEASTQEQSVSSGLAYQQGLTLGNSLRESFTWAQGFTSTQQVEKACSVWAGNALREGFVASPNGGGAADLVFDPNDSDEADAFAEGCNDGAP